MAISDSASVQVLIWPRASVADVAAGATPVMSTASSPEPVAASVTLRPISLVVAVSSSTALAMSSPARAVSIVAFNASRFVGSAMDVTTLITLPIS